MLNWHQIDKKRRRKRTLYALLIVVRPCCFTVVFSGVVNVTVTKKLKRAVSVTFLLFRSSRRQHEVQAASLIYLALLLRNVARSLLQNIDHVKMLYVNLCNLFHCCYCLCVDFCCSFCSVFSITL